MARARTLWEEGTEPGRRVVALGAAGTLTAAVADLLLTDGLGWLFDVGFVLCCVATALLVRARDFFTVGVLPPLMMLGLFWLLALTARGRIADEDDAAVQAVITGLAHHAGALVTGYVLCLACLEIRRRVLAEPRRQRRTGPVPAPRQPSNRSGSPAPRRTTVGTSSE